MAQTSILESLTLKLKSVTISNTKIKDVGLTQVLFWANATGRPSSTAAAPLNMFQASDRHE